MLGRNFQVVEGSNHSTCKGAKVASGIGGKGHDNVFRMTQGRKTKRSEKMQNPWRQGSGKNPHPEPRGPEVSGEQGRTQGKKKEVTWGEKIEYASGRIGSCNSSMRRRGGKVHTLSSFLQTM